MLQRKTVSRSVNWYDDVNHSLTWYSLGSASGAKFGVFGYCYTTNNTCSSIQVGYDPDNILSNVPSSSLAQSHGSLQRRQASQPSISDAVDGNSAQSQSPFNLPADARNNLTNVLVVHVVAAGLTFFLLLMSLVGHLPKTRQSTAYMLGTILLSVPTIILTLLAFLVDILIFVPNLDWGTWITLGATILNAIAGVSICTARRRLGTRKAMRARIAENDAMNSESYYNSQHMQDTEPEGEALENDKATLPRFAQFERASLPDVERVPLNRLDPDGHSLRSETPSRTSPPRYPLATDGYGPPPEMHHPGSSPYAEPEYRRQQIPYGNPPRQPFYSSRDRSELDREPLYHSDRDSEIELQAPLAHSDPDSARRLDTDWHGRPEEPILPASIARVEQRRVPGDDWPSGSDPAVGARPSRGPRQRVVSGPRDMPSARRPPVRSSSTSSYHEDVPPQFEQPTRYTDEDHLHNGVPTNRSRRQRSRGSNTFERPPYPEQPRSPDTISNSSHFTSVSQRGINPRWHGEGQQPGMPYSRSHGTLARPARSERRMQPNILADNPDFVLPGLGGKTRLPQSRRPGAIPGLSSNNLGSGQSPYAITKGA